MAIGKKHTLQNYFFVGFVIICILEILLRLFGINQTNEEQTLNYYNYKYKTYRPTWFHTWQPNSNFEYGNGEFLFHNSINELGHRELSFEEFNKDTSSIKMVFLGDSFTEGDGAPYDSAWVRFFEQKLEFLLDTPIWAYNAGICGSDVVFNGIMLKENLISTKPTVVFECVNSSDILDILYRGGKNRFLSNGSLGAPNLKRWEPLYKYSYLFRSLLHIFSSYDNNLVNSKTKERDENQALFILVEQLKETQKLCEQHDISYHVIMMPTPSEIKTRHEQLFDSLAILLPSEVSLINIYPDMYLRFDSLDIRKYSWEKNGHFNSAGYEIMSESISKEFLLLKSNKLIDEN